MFRSRLFQGFKQCKNTVMPKRKLGSGGAHGHGHEVSKGPLKPYEVPHHPTYANEAYFLGINPNEKYQWQGYEAAILVYLLAFGILASPSKVEDDDLRVWAREEALARRKVVADGGTIEFGTWYNVQEFQENEMLDEMPVQISSYRGERELKQLKD